MAAPTGSTQTQLGTEIVLMAAGSSSAVSDGAFAECTSDDLQQSDVDGAEFALFEFDAGGTFSAAPTTSGTINVYEQTINSDGTDAPDVDANYKHDFIGSLAIYPADVAQYKAGVFPINYWGGKYWIEWLDNGGSAGLSAGWELRATPLHGGLKA